MSGKMEHVDYQALEYFTEKMKSLIESSVGSGGGTKTLTTQYVRVWELEDGIYEWTYAGQKYLYYYGATSTNTTTAGSSTHTTVFLTVTKYSSTDKVWRVDYWYSTTAPYIQYGYTSSTGGASYTRDYSKIPTVTVKNPAYTSSQYNVGFYYSTSTLSSINVTTYLYPGEYGLYLSASATGNPTGVAQRVVLKSYNCNYTYSNSTYYPIKQELHCLSSNRKFERYVTYSSGYVYGDWVEIFTKKKITLTELQTLLTDSSNYGKKLEFHFKPSEQYDMITVNGLADELFQSVIINSSNITTKRSAIDPSYQDELTFWTYHLYINGANTSAYPSLNGRRCVMVYSQDPTMTNDVDEMLLLTDSNCDIYLIG